MRVIHHNGDSPRAVKVPIEPWGDISCCDATINRLRGNRLIDIGHNVDWTGLAGSVGDEQHP